jgi:hypothetical protein
MPPRPPRPSFHALGDVLRDIRREDGSVDLSALQRARTALRRGAWWVPDEMHDPVDLEPDDDADDA